MKKKQVAIQVAIPFTKWAISKISITVIFGTFRKEERRYFTGFLVWDF